MAEHGPARWTGGKKQVQATESGVTSTDDFPAEPTPEELGADVDYAPAVNEAAVEVDATEAAVKYAAEHDIDLATVMGTGTGGRITKDDVEAAVGND